jgi:hypothetical protein
VVDVDQCALPPKENASSRMIRLVCRGRATSARLETVVGDTRFDLQHLPLGLEEDAGAVAEDVGEAPEAEPEPEDEAPTKGCICIWVGRGTCTAPEACQRPEQEY